jgi:hypothetical protein
VNKGDFYTKGERHTGLSHDQQDERHRPLPFRPQRPRDEDARGEGKKGITDGGCKSCTGIYDSGPTNLS